MLFQPHIRTKSLAQLCRRVGTSLEAGVDARRVFAREAERGTLVERRQVQGIRQTVDRGGALADAVEDSAPYFPPLFREMVAVGEATGKLDAVLLRLADHYEDQVRLRRIFLAGIAWPLIQLAAAIVVIGLLIWILGLIGNTDILGFNLTGTRGLLIYLGIVGCAGSVVAVLIYGAMRGWFWSRALQRWLLRVPGLGGSLRTIALSRMAWAMSVTFNSEMDAWRALELAIRSTGNARYTDHLSTVQRSIQQGDAVHTALRRTGVFPVEFVDALEVGEESGQLSETVARLADQLRDQATMAFRVLAVVAGFAVWGMVALMIIFMIFRLAAFYIGTIQDAAKGIF